MSKYNAYSKLNRINIVIVIILNIKIDLSSLKKLRTKETDCLIAI